MAALERYFLARGFRVAGYDLTRTQLTDALVSEGVEICFDEAAALIPDYCKNPADTLVVYTPAIPASHEGLNYFRNGVGGHEKMIDLGFDASDDFHTYAFEWHKDKII